MSIFEILQKELDLLEVASDHLDLTSSGKTRKGPCPYHDHEDSNPSCHFYSDGRFWCFGCGRGGDVIDLWAVKKGFKSSIEAALDLAREYGIELPEVDPEAREKAEERRELEAKYLKQAKENHGLLSRHSHVTEWWEKRGFDEELRERFLLGASEDGTEAIIPFWHRGRVQGLIRRKLEGEPKYRLLKKEEFPDGYRPPFIPGATRKNVMVVEGYVDALALTAVGIDAIAVGGTGMSRAQKEELWALPCPVYLMPDNDEEGRKAGRKWAEDLYPRALLCPPPYEEEKEEESREEEKK